MRSKDPDSVIKKAMDVARKAVTPVDQSKGEGKELSEGGAARNIGFARGGERFLKTAVKIGDKVHVGSEREKHGDLGLRLGLTSDQVRNALGWGSAPDPSVKMGFVNHKGHFLDRNSSYNYAVKEGLVSPAYAKFINANNGPQLDSANLLPRQDRPDWAKGPLEDQSKQGLATGGDVPDAVMAHRDAPTQKLQDMPWRPLKDVHSDLGGMSEIPSHVVNFGRFMDETADRAAGKGLSARDLIKAYLITRSSIGRGALKADTVRREGFEIPHVKGMIRPEGAMGEWLQTPMGQAYLHHAEQGKVHPEAVAHAMAVMKPFGKSNATEGHALPWAAQNLPGMEDHVSKMVTAGRHIKANPEEWREFIKNIPGVATSKAGFIGSMLGRGDQPTLDARQIILHTGKPTSEAKKPLERVGAAGEAVDRLSARQSALGFKLDPGLMPYYQHLAHHAIWDKVAGEQTTHEDLMNAMRHAKRGGRIHAAKGGSMTPTTPLADHEMAYALIHSGLIPAFHVWTHASDDKAREVLKDIPDFRHGNPDKVKKALEIAKNAYSINPTFDPKVGQGYYGFKGDKKPISDVQSTVEPIPGAEPKPVRNMSWEDFGRQAKGGTLLNLGGDRSRLGRLTHIEGQKLGWPVDLHAGPDYMREPNKGAVWANAKGASTRINRAIAEHQKKGDVYGYYTPMGPKSVDSSKQMMDAVMAQLASKPMPPEAAKEFDAMIKSGAFVPGQRPEDLKDRANAAKAMESWPGVHNAREARDHLLSNLSGAQRSLLIKHLDKADWHGKGVPHIGKTRVAVTDPNMRDTPGNMLGPRIVKLTGGSPKPSAFEHNTYPETTGGEYVGDVPPVMRHYALPEVVRQFAQNPKGSKGNMVMHPLSEDLHARSGFRKMTEEQKVAQPINDEMMQGVGHSLETQQALRRAGVPGFADGGGVGDDSAPPRNVNSMGFYSQGAETAQNLKQSKGSGAQMVASLKGVKPAEMQASGVADMASRPTLTRDEMVSQFNKGMPPILEKTLTQNHDDDEDGPSDGEAQFGEYTLPGGKNYREVLMHLPKKHYDQSALKAAQQNYKDITQRIVDLMKANPSNPLDHPDMENLLSSREAAQKEQARELEKDDNFYHRGHWGNTPNVLAHLRLSDRETKPTPEQLADIENRMGKANGLPEKGLSNSNLGSGAADAAIRKGAITPEEAASISRHRHWYNEHARKPGLEKKLLHMEELQSDWGQQLRDEDPNNKKLPTGPFVTSTHGWADLGLKRALIEAAKGGYHGLVWTPGHEQAERYGLADKVSRIHYNPASNFLTAYDMDGSERIKQPVKPEELPDYIGHELSKKLLGTKPEPLKEHWLENHEGPVGKLTFHDEDEADEFRRGRYPHRRDITLASNDLGPHHVLKGDDMEVGGEGMKTFYDQIVPRRLMELTKKLDPEAKVGLNSVPIGGSPAKEYHIEPHPREPGYRVINHATGHSPHGSSAFPTEEHARDWASKWAKDVPPTSILHHLPITDKMRAAILKGLPQYHQGGDVRGYAIGGAPTPSKRKMPVSYSPKILPSMADPGGAPVADMSNGTPSLAVANTVAPMGDQAQGQSSSSSMIPDAGSEDGAGRGPSPTGSGVLPTRGLQTQPAPKWGSGMTMGDLQAKLKEVYPNLSTGQCVELAQQMGGVGNVHEWERGAPVAQVRPPIGAVVSTFGWNGDSDKYAYGGSGTPGIGRDHAGIVAGYDDNGMLLLNQWKGQEPTYTHYNWDGPGEHGASNYFIINQGGKPAGVNATLLNPQSTGSDMSNAPGSKRGGAVDKAMGLVRKKRAGGGALEDAIMGFANQRAAGVNRPVTSGSMAPASQNWQGQTHLASVSPPPAQSDQSVIRDAGDLGRSAEAAYGTLSGRDKALPNTGPVSNGSAPASYNGDPKKADRSTVEAYIRDRAKAYGIDPDVAVAVAKSEGLNAFDPTKPDLGGDEHSSFGPFQLHYGGVSQNMPHPGMGDDFTKATGMHASDPSSWPQQVDFALSHASNNGWNAWSGARDSAGRFLGLGQNSLPSMTYGIGGQRAPAPTTQDAGTQNYGRPAQTSFADPSQSYQPQQTAMTTGVSYPQANPQAALVEGRPAPQKDPSQQDNSPAATNAARGGSIVDQAMRMTRRRHRDAGGATTPAPAASGPADGSGWFGQATPPGKNDITPSSLANDQNFPSNGGHISTDQMMELLSATVGGNFPRSGSGGDQTTPAPAAPATPTIPKGTVGNSYNIQGAPGGSAATGHYDNTLNEVLGTNNPNMTQVFGFNYPGGSGPSNVPPGGFGTVPMAVPHAATGSPLGGDGSKAYIGAKRGGSIVDKAMALSRSTRKRKA